MTHNPEIDAISTIDAVLSKISDSATHERILRWAWEKYGNSDIKAPSRKLTKPSKQLSKGKTEAKKRSGKSTKPKLVSIKGLDLHPKGKQSFADFALEKSPANNEQRCVVSVHYLSTVLEILSVTGDHVYTCFKNNKWPIPADITNTLQRAASLHNWIDTSDMNNILLAPQGEHLIEHGLSQKKDK